MNVRSDYHEESAGSVTVREVLERARTDDGQAALKSVHAGGRLPEADGRRPAEVIRNNAARRRWARICDMPDYVITLRASPPESPVPRFAVPTTGVMEAASFGLRHFDASDAHFDVESTVEVSSDNAEEGIHQMTVRKVLQWLNEDEEGRKFNVAEGMHRLTALAKELKA